MTTTELDLLLDQIRQGAAAFVNPDEVRDELRDELRDEVIQNLRDELLYEAYNGGRQATRSAIEEGILTPEMIYTALQYMPSWQRQALTVDGTLAGSIISEYVRLRAANSNIDEQCSSQRGQVVIQSLAANLNRI